MRLLSPGLARALPLAALLLAPWSSGCSSLPAEVSGATNLRVSYWDFREDAELVLVNESNPEYEDFYSKPRDSASVKLAPDEQLHELVEFAGGEGFFDYATSLAGPTDELRDRAFRMIAINADGRDWSMVLEPGVGERDPDQVRAFDAVQRRIQDVYNSIFSLQVLSSEKAGPDFFDRERARLEQENADRAKKGGGR